MIRDELAVEAETQEATGSGDLKEKKDHIT